MQQQIDGLVETEIKQCCKEVIERHVEKIGVGKDRDNMDYIVKNGKKQAIFKLDDPNRTFGQIKSQIAKYFQLPDDIIFLQNNKKEILLRDQKVLDELFPLKSCKIKGEQPVIHVIFQKKMSTLDYILGDPNIAKDEEKAQKH